MPENQKKNKEAFLNRIMQESVNLANSEDSDGAEPMIEYPTLPEDVEEPKTEKQ